MSGLGSFAARGGTGSWEAPGVAGDQLASQASLDCPRVWRWDLELVFLVVWLCPGFLWSLDCARAPRCVCLPPLPGAVSFPPGPRR